jgi:hypothetical protein
MRLPHGARTTAIQSLAGRGAAIRVTDFYSVGCRFESCWDRQF